VIIITSLSYFAADHFVDKRVIVNIQNTFSRVVGYILLIKTKLIKDSRTWFKLQI